MRATIEVIIVKSTMKYNYLKGSACGSGSSISNTMQRVSHDGDVAQHSGKRPDEENWLTFHKYQTHDR